MQWRDHADDLLDPCRRCGGRFAVAYRVSSDRGALAASPHRGDRQRRRRLPRLWCPRRRGHPYAEDRLDRATRDPILERLRLWARLQPESSRPDDGSLSAAVRSRDEHSTEVQRGERPAADREDDRGRAARQRLPDRRARQVAPGLRGQVSPVVARLRALLGIPPRRTLLLPVKEADAAQSPVARSRGAAGDLRLHDRRARSASCSLYRGARRQAALRVSRLQRRAHADARHGRRPGRPQGRRSPPQVDRDDARAGSIGWLRPRRARCCGDHG